MLFVPVAVRRVHRQRQADPRLLQGRDPVSGARRLSGGEVRRLLAVTDYRDPVIQDEIKANGWMIWPPIRYSYRTVNNDIPEAAPAKPSWLYDKEKRCQPLSAGRRRPELHDRQLELARHRRPGARRAGARHLRLPHLGAVRADPDARLGGHRRVGRRRAGLFRRLDRPAVPALHRDLVVDPGALSAADHRRRAAARLLRPARPHAAVLLGRAWSAWCGPSSCAPATSNMSTRRARSASPTAPSCSGTCCPTPWWRR